MNGKRLLFLIWACFLFPSLALADDFGKSLPTWIELLKNGNTIQKKIALDNLVGLRDDRYNQDESVWDPVIAALADPDPTVREAAAELLKIVGGVVAETKFSPAIVKTLEDISPQVRAQAVAAIGEHYKGIQSRFIPDQKEWNKAKAKAAALLIKSLHDADPWVRLNAVSALKEVPTVEALRPLMVLLEDETDWRNKYVQQEAIVSLRRIMIVTGSSKEALEMLVKRASDPYLKREIIKTFDVRPRTDLPLGVKEVVLEAIHDKDDIIRLFAHRMAQKLGQYATKVPVENNPPQSSQKSSTQFPTKSELAEMNVGYRRGGKEEVIDPRLLIDREILNDIFKKSLSDPSPAIRDLSIRALGPRNPEIEARLVKALNDPDNKTQRDVLESLLTGRDKIEENVLVAVVNYIVGKRREAEYALYLLNLRVTQGPGQTGNKYPPTWKNPAIATALLSGLDKADVITKLNMLTILARIEDERVIKLFKELLNDPNPAIQKLAARSVEDLSTTDSLSLLFSRLKNKDPSTRRQGIDELWNLRFSSLWTPDTRSKVKEAILPMLQDEDRTVRVSAVTVLSQFRDPTMAELFFPMLDNADEMLRNAALQFLTDVNDPRAVDANIKMLKDTSKINRGWAISHLRKKRDPRAVEALVQLMRENDDSNAASAATALGDIGDRRAVQPLIEALNGGFNKGSAIIDNGSTDLQLRKSAANALGVMKEKNALPHLIKILLNNSEYPSLRSDAARAIGMIGDPSALDGLRKAMKSGNIGEDMSYKIETKNAIEMLERLKNSGLVK